MMRVIQKANRPPAIAGAFSDSGRPESRTSRQTTSRVRATDAGMAMDRRRWRKICG
jgi:hypothetical protein